MPLSIDQVNSSAKNFDPEKFKDNPNRSQSDPRFWTLSKDSDGQGAAKIRFIPSECRNEVVRYVKVIRHYFIRDNKTYANVSRRTLNQKDPVSDFNNLIYRKDPVLAKSIVAGQSPNATKQIVNYISNIYVVDDYENPENNGKVFLFRYGKKLFEKLEEVIAPKYANIPSVDVFDIHKGPVFNIKVRKKGQWPTYENSAFSDNLTPLCSNNRELQGVLDQIYDVYEFVDPKSIKSYEELEEEMIMVLGDQYYEAMGMENPNYKPSRTVSTPAPRAVVENSSPTPSVTIKKNTREEVLSEEDEELMRMIDEA